MMRLLIAGVLAGLAFGYVLMRADLCFHSMFRGIFERRFSLFRAWILAVAIAAVGLSLIFATGWWDQLNRGLPLRPASNVAGGLLIGTGMVVASSCVSGLFYKLGAGMLGAAVGLLGWGLGELAGRRIRLPGPTILDGGEGATIPGVLGVPRLAVAVPLLVIVLALLRRAGRGDPPGARWQWGWRIAGISIGLAAVAGWALAGAGGASFGPSTTSMVAGVASGRPNWWLIGFLLALIPGAAIAARTAGGWWVRGETGPRYAQLGAGGFLLGMGGIIGGGCNLGHGLSGLAQMNVSSVLVVGSMIAGVGLARAVRERIRGREPDWTPVADAA